MSLQAKLTVVGGKASKRTIALQLPTTIGRSRDADLTVSHPQVSRKHCELIEADGLIVVRDSGSLNGTYVGGERIKQAPLLPEATFSIGPLTFRVNYQLDGEHGPLPPVIADDRRRNAAAEDNKISQTLPAAGGSTKQSPGKETPADKASLDQPPAAESSADEEDDDPAFEDFLKDLEGD